MEYKERAFIAVVILLLLALIVLSAVKISIFFRSFLFLSKKKNYDKANYIANSSFYQYYYNNPYLYGKINIEMLFMVMLVLLFIVAVYGNLVYGATNYGYLNYYYGDYDEYNFVDYYIKIIMILGVIYFFSYFNWFVYNKVDDDKLLTNEVALKAFVLENIDYTYLYDYYIWKSGGGGGAYSIDTYITKYRSGDALKDQNTFFKLCFTIHLLSPSRTEFANIQAKIFSICDMIPASEKDNYDKFKLKIDEALNASSFYIIANYNNNNNIALPPLDKLIKDTLSSVTNGDIKKIRDGKLKELRENSQNVSTMKSTYETGRDHFTNTIKVYKEVYGKYYTYYIYSVLITNFLITYSILIFLYILIKLVDSSSYSIYTFKSDMNKYGYYILALYYLLTSPIILFGSA